MGKTYCQIFLQLIFSVKNREALISESIREEVQQYMTGVITNKECQLYAVYANPDHVHLLVSIPTSLTISNLVRCIKSNVSKYINENKLTSTLFRWQDGYGVFSYSSSHIDDVIRYIHHQPEHHKKRNSESEYIDIIQKYRMTYDAEWG